LADPIRDHWLETRLHALDDLARRLSEGGQFMLAIDAALSVIAIEPLRETSWRALILAHLAEGNPAHGRSTYEQFRCVLRDEFEADPSPQLSLLVGATPA
jgi:DNA-binding SARP family transcriptional activator